MLYSLPLRILFDCSGSSEGMSPFPRYSHLSKWIPLKWITCLKGKGSPYWITERRVLELITVLGSQP